MLMAMSDRHNPTTPHPPSYYPSQQEQEQNSSYRCPYDNSSMRNNNMLYYQHHYNTDNYSISPTSNYEDMRLPSIQCMLPVETKIMNNDIQPNSSPSSPLDLHANMMHKLFNASTSRLHNNIKNMCGSSSSSLLFSPSVSSIQNHHSPNNKSLLTMKIDNMHAKSTSCHAPQRHENNINITTDAYMSNQAKSYMHSGKEVFQYASHPSTSDMSDNNENTDPTSKKRKDIYVNTNLSTSSNDNEDNAFNPERTKMACSVCRIAKKKCDGKEPCSRCFRLGKECKFSNTGKARGRPKKHSTENVPNQLHFHSFEEQPIAKKRKSSNE